MREETFDAICDINNLITFVFSGIDDSEDTSDYQSKCDFYLYKCLEDRLITLKRAEMIYKDRFEEEGKLWIKEWEEKNEKKKIEFFRDFQKRIRSSIDHYIKWHTKKGR